MRASLFGTLAGGGAAIDPNAQAFITAAGIVDATQITAINDWFVGRRRREFTASLMEYGCGSAQQNWRVA